MIRKIITIFVMMSILISFSPTMVWAGGSSASVSSPNGKVDLTFNLNENGEPQYQLFYEKVQLVEPSSLGFQFKEQDPLNSNFEIVDTEMETFNESWEPVWGEKATIKNHYNQLTVYLQEKESPHRKMNLVFRAYDDGIGFRYVLPKQENLDENLQITSEDTEFKFSSNNTSWWIPNDWDSYEYNYNQTPLSEVEEVSTPFTMKTPEGIHMTVHEAELVDYSEMALQAVKGENNTFKSILAPWPDSNVKVKKDSLPVETPWRTIEVGEDAGDLVESDMILNLNEPSKIDDTSWIEPMKYVGVWWEMISGKSTWASGEKHGATTENAKRYIDFANQYLDTKNQNIGLLVEGWNIGWDGNWMENGDQFSFTEPYPDYDLEEVVKYSQDNNVSYIMHNETSGDIINYENQMDKAYDLYQQLGIHAIKSGYVADHGMYNPEGQKHHGQYMVNHYNQAVKKAAEHQIMINTHEPIKSTGLERTYPNWMSREGVMGMEYAAFGDQNNPPEHDTILPFTRMMAGPIDFTPGIFDVEISHADTRVHTTRAKQLAMYVTISSGTQMVADLPENYKDEDGKILPEFKFIKDVPVTWDDIMVPNAEIGDYATIVRRSGEEFYIGSITDEKARDLDVDLDFLEKGKKYVAEIYSDAHDADLEQNPEAVSIQKVIVSHKDTLVASLATGGGQAVRMYPASKEERKELPKYKKPKLKLSYQHVPEVIQSNDEFQVTVEAENTSEVVTGKTFQLMVDGEQVAEEKIRIAPQSTKEVTLSYNKLFEPGKYKVQVDGLGAKQVKVNEKEPTFEYSDLSVKADGERIMAGATVTNYGTTSGTTTVPFTVNGEEVNTKDLEVPAQAGGGTQKVTFTYDTNGKADVYNVSIGNLVPEPIAMPLINLAGSWLFQKGDNETWKSPEFDDSSWQEVTLPSSWEDHSNYLEDDTYGWYRKSLHIPEEWKGYSLKVKLGKIDDVDQTFVNGQMIGESGTFPTGEGEQGMISAWDWEREYTIPADMIRYGEENVLSIRVFDAKSGGGLYDGPLTPIELIKEDEDNDE